MASNLLFLGICLAVIAIRARSSGESSGGNGGGPVLHFTLEPPALVIAHKSLPFYLNCSASSTESHPSVNITWLHNGQPVNDVRRHVLRESGSLYFRRIVKRTGDRDSEDDSGIYQCVARVDRLGAIVSRKSHLVLAELGRFSESPADTSATVGDNVRLSCNIEGSPKPNISWTKNKQTLPLSTNRLTTLASGVLQISSVVQSDAGDYRCVAENGVRTRRSSIGTLTVTNSQG